MHTSVVILTIALESWVSFGAPWQLVSDARSRRRADSLVTAAVAQFEDNDSALGQTDASHTAAEANAVPESQEDQRSTLSSGVWSGRRSASRGRSERRGSDRPLIEVDGPIVNPITGGTDDQAATAIVLGQPVSGSIGNGSEVDVYELSGVFAGQTLFFDQTATSNEFGLNWRLEDRWGRVILSNPSAMSDLGAVKLMGGTYRVFVYSEGNQAGTYTFRVVNVSTQSFNIAIGDVVSGSINANSPGQSHDYTFSATAGQRVFVDVLATSNFGGLNWRLENSLGRLIFMPTNSFGGVFDDGGVFSLLGGAYTLTVIGEGDQSGTYQFQIVTVSDESSTFGIGDSVSGSIASPGQRDLLTFTAAHGQEVYVDVVATSNSGGLNWFLTDSVGRLIFTPTNAFGGVFDDGGPFTLLGGDYGFTIQGEGASTGTYTFRVVDVVTQSSMIAIGDTVSGGISDAAERDEYSFTTMANQIVMLDQLSTSNSSGLNWMLLDNLDRAILARTTSLVDSASLTLMGGTYRLVVLGENSQTGTYQFKLVDQGMGSYTPSGTPIAVGDEVMGTVMPAGGTVSHTIPIGAGQRVFFDVLQNSSNLEWQLLDAVGQQVFVTSANSSDTGDAGPFALVAGTYTLQLRATSAGASPAYRFKVWSVVDTSTPVALDTTIMGSFANQAGATQAHTFSLGSTTTLFFDRITATSRTLWTLIDEVGLPVFALIDADGSDVDDVGPITLVSGDYSLVMDAEFGYQPTFDFNIRQVTNTMSAVSVDALQTGTFVGATGATQTYEFSLPTDTKVYFDRITGTNRLLWSLYDSTGQNVFVNIDADSADVGDRGPMSLAAGIYRLVFDAEFGYSPAYDFRVVSVDDVSTPLLINTSQSVGVMSAGSIVEYPFVAFEGQRLLFDLTQGASSLTWSLIDPVGTPVFLLQSANNTTTSDRGPMNLTAGAYRLILDPSFSNTPSYAFTARNIASDLRVASIDASPRTFFDTQIPRNLSVSWTVVDDGGGPVLPTTWTDRIVLSSDLTIGNADDQALGSFPIAVGLTPHGSYSRTEQVVVPNSVAGDFHVFVVTDVLNDVMETLGEANNTANVRLAIVNAPPPVIDTTTTLMSFPVSFTTPPGPATFDLPLYGEMSLDAVRFILSEALILDVRATTGNIATTLVRVTLLNGTTEVMEVGTWDIEHTGPGATGGAKGVARFSRRVTADDAAALPINVVDAVRFTFEQPLTTYCIVSSIHADGRFRCHFSACEFDPCGPHQERVFNDLPAIVFNGAGMSDWQTNMFVEPVVGDELRLVDGPEFGWSVTSSFVLPFTSSEAQLILDDGSFVTLDNWQGPSTLAAPTVGVSGQHSLGLDGDQMDGRMIIGFRWRVHVTGGIGPQSTYTPTNPLILSFLYGADMCVGAIPVAPIAVSPPDGSYFAAGSYVTLSGRALRPDAMRPISVVLVNDEPVDSLDAAGRFFKRVPIGEGDNVFVVKVIEPACGETQTLLRLNGVTPQTETLGGFAEVTALLDAEYMNTTYNQIMEAMIVRARVRNVSDVPVDGPILMVIGDQLDESITPMNPDGLTLEGRPYVVVQGAGALLPGQAGAEVTLVFHNPDRVPVNYEESFLARANRAPAFTSTPPVFTRESLSYLYEATAVDPDGHAVAYSLTFAPIGMSIDAQSGLINWTPQPTDLGLHEVLVAADDNRGGRAEQQYTLSVVSIVDNRPPVFTSAPVTHASTGAAYSYDANAVDADGDMLQYALVGSPSFLAIDSLTGVISWSFALPGQYAIRVEANDGNGGVAAQEYALTVGSVSSNPSAPLITTIPPSVAVVDVLYVYQAVAHDADGDTLTFTLTQMPGGIGVVPSTGRITWTPTAMQPGDHDVTMRVTDGRGGASEQQFSVHVQASPTNLPPIFDSVPGGFVVVGEQYNYNASAFDPEGQGVAFAPVAVPMTMMVDPGSGVVTWSPTLADVGGHSVAIRASDALMGTSTQVFQIEVRASNDDPLFDSTPVLDVIVGQTYDYDATAMDADGDLLRYALTTSPPGMAIDAITGVIVWHPAASDVGLHAVQIDATDCCGGLAQQLFTVTVNPDVAPPEVSIRFSQSPVPVGEPVTVVVLASDDIAIDSMELSVGCTGEPEVVLPLDVFHQATFQRSTPGSCTFTAIVTDPFGNETIETSVLAIGDPMAVDPYPPIVQIISPAPESVLTGPTDILATILDDTPDGQPGSTLTWTVQIARFGSELAAGEFTVIGSGSGEVVGGVIATLDPTLLPNDNYRLQIVGNDGLQTGGIEFQYAVSGVYKMGNFIIDFTDLTLPLGGIPLVVTRHYNSLDTTVEDFGAGWRLGLPGKVADSAVESTTGNSFVDLLSTQPFNNKTRVYVTRPDGQRVGFTFAPEALPFPQAFQSRPAFRPDAGVADMLEAVSPTGSTTVWNFGTGYLEYVIPYNPRTYRFTTGEGVTYTINEVDGLQLIEDVHGNTITVTPQGLVSSLGTAITFNRDSLGRIERIIEPDPHPGDAEPPGELLYEYDPSGNLVKFTNQAGAEVNYVYSDPVFPYYLTEIQDQTGAPIIRNVFDADGRLVAQCDADGDPVTLDGCVSFDNDVVAGVQTVINARGFRMDLIMDDRGFVAIERRYQADGSSFVDWTFDHDERGNITGIVDPDGGTTTFVYDEDGNPQSKTTPDGRTWSYAYGACRSLESEVDPDGNVLTYTYDADCRLRFSTEPVAGTTEIRYDSRGLVSEVIDPEVSTWAFTYDAMGNPCMVTDPLGNSATMEFDFWGNLLWEIDRTGRRIDYVYDEVHRLTDEVWDTVPPHTIHYDYDAGGQLASISDPHSTLTITYWNNGLVRSVSNAGTPNVPTVAVTYGYPDGMTIASGYDGNAQVTHVMDSLGVMTEYQYDALDRMSSVRQYSIGGVVNEKRVDIAHNDNDAVSSIVRYADLGGANPVTDTRYEYACPGCFTRLSAIRHRRASDDSVIHDLVYDIDGHGNVLSVTDLQGVHTYAYDSLLRLVAADHPPTSPQPDESYSYDLVGNRLASHQSSSYVYSYMVDNGGHQLRQDDQYDYEYDANGNLIRRTDRVASAYRELGYDYRDRLTSVKEFSAVGVLTSTISFTYDALDRRIRMSDGTSALSFVYDRENPILVFDGSGALVTRRLYGTALDDLFADEMGGLTRWPLADLIGSIRDVVLSDTSIANRYVYDSFGSIVEQSNPSFDNAVTFAERELDASLGWMYFRARYYDPTLGRFTQEDPFTPYRYEYVDGNPFAYVDPTGLGPLIEYRPLICGTGTCIYVGCQLIKAIPTVVYIGIAKSPARRAAQHARKGRSFILCAIQDFVGGLPRDEARAWEQAMINANGGSKGSLQNIANSVSKTSPVHNRVRQIARTTGKLGLKRLGLLTCKSCLK